MTRTEGTRSASTRTASRLGRRRRLELAMAAALGVSLIASQSVAGQESTLDAVERLAREGSTEEARSLILAWWEAPPSDAAPADLQRGLWLRGRLTLDPAEAAADYRRLVDEYPHGPYADRALLRLALESEAREDLATAHYHYSSLAQAYPSGDPGRYAAAWLSGHDYPAPSPDPSGPTVDRGPPEATPGPTVGDEPVAAGEAGSVDNSSPEAAPGPGVVDENAVPGQAESLDPVPAEAGSRSAAPNPAAVTDQEEPVGLGSDLRTADGPFTVQIGAYLSAARATRMAERVTEAGFRPRIVHVPGSPLFRVRVGRFDSSSSAAPLADSLAISGFATYVTANAATERPYR